MTVDDLEMDLFARKDGLRERDLSAHLSNARAVARRASPAEVVRYDLPSAEREAIRDRGGDLDDDSFQVDFPMRFARDLAARLPAGHEAPRRAPRRRTTSSSRRARTRSPRSRPSSASSASTGATRPADPSQVAVAEGPRRSRSRPTAPNNEVTAGEPMDAPGHRHEQRQAADLPPARRRPTATTPTSTPRSSSSARSRPGRAEARQGAARLVRRRGPQDRLDQAARTRTRSAPARSRWTRSPGATACKVKFDAAGGDEPAPVEVRPTIHALERPMFQYGYQIADDRAAATATAASRRASRSTMYLTVKNAGKGRSFDTQANIAQPLGRRAPPPRRPLRHLEHDARRRAQAWPSPSTCSQQLADNEATLTLSVGDRDLREFVDREGEDPGRAARADRAGRAAP